MDEDYRARLLQTLAARSAMSNPMEEAASLLKSLDVDFCVRETPLEFAVSRIDFATSVWLPNDVKDCIRETFEKWGYPGFKKIYSFGYVKRYPCGVKC
jgi:hypothetical protein